ncbi:hypothetical protein Tco_1314314 [Tanacetum coccineum]
MREEHNQPEVIQELLLKLMDDLQILKGSQQEKKETAAQGFIPYLNSSMIDDEEARDNFLKDVCTFLRKFSRIPFGITPKVIFIAWESFGKIKDALTDKQYRQEDIQELMSKLLEDVRNISEEFSEYINCPSLNCPLFYFDDDDDEYTVIWRRPKVITPFESSEEPEDPLIIGEKELRTIPEKDKSSVEDLVPIPSRSKGISDDTCDNSDAESLLSQGIPITSPKIDFLSEEFAGEFAPIPPGMDEDGFDEEEVDCYDHDISSDNESYVTPPKSGRSGKVTMGCYVKVQKSRYRKTLIDSSPKFDYLFEEFSGELAHIDPIPPGIEKADFYLEEEIRLVENLLYDNSSPRPSEELNLEIADTILESLSLHLLSPLRIVTLLWRRSMFPHSR